MTDEERALYDTAKHCHNCGAEFTRTNQQKKCRHHFLSTSLDNLVSLLLKDSKERFRHTTKYLGSDEIVFSKGVYPYSHMTVSYTHLTLPTNREV